MQTISVRFKICVFFSRTIQKFILLQQTALSILPNPFSFPILFLTHRCNVEYFSDVEILTYLHHTHTSFTPHMLNIFMYIHYFDGVSFKGEKCRRKLLFLLSDIDGESFCSEECEGSLNVSRNNILYRIISDYNVLFFQFWFVYRIISLYMNKRSELFEGWSCFGCCHGRYW